MAVWVVTQGRRKRVGGLHFFENQLVYLLGQLLVANDNDTFSVKIGASWIKIKGPNHDDFFIDDHGLGMEA